AIAKLEPLSQRKEPNLSFARHFLSITYLSRAAALAKLSKQREAMASLRAARTLREQLVSEDANAPYHLVELAASHHLEGNLCKKFQKKEEALKCYRTACALQERLVREYPGVPQYVEHLATTYYDIAGVHEDLGQPTEALSFYEAERPLREQQVRYH